jgi:hypothetical protein
LSRYKPVGWRQEAIRHSLAAKGLTKRYSFVANSLKGNRSKPWDPKFVDPKTGEVKDLKKSLQAKGFETTGGREYRKVGDTPDYVGGPVIAATQVTELQTLPQAELIPSQLTNVSGDTMPTVSIPENPEMDLEQQAQQVEGGPYDVGSAPLPILEPGDMTQQLSSSELPEIDYGESREGLLIVPEVATPGVPPEPTTMESDRL